MMILLKPKIKDILDLTRNETKILNFVSGNENYLRLCCIFIDLQAYNLFTTDKSISPNMDRELFNF